MRSRGSGAALIDEWPVAGPRLHGLACDGCEIAVDKKNNVVAGIIRTIAGHIIICVFTLNVSPIHTLCELNRTQPVALELHTWCLWMQLQGPRLCAIELTVGLYRRHINYL